ncbi:MAG TPA: 1-acyl-sn-glycerol-3-phosphate acyltransferase [Gemmatimonadales bacterium]|nr:1-acyl-sn-glycerol-3-phosphate acyltransferase [Gemmatimonadales bacterium]
MTLSVAPSPVSRLPIAAPPPYEPFDPEYCRALVHDVIGPIAADYFRVKLIDAGRIPKHGPVILAANHSGNAFPYDGIFADAAMWQADGMDPAAKLRTVFEPELAFVWWMRPFGLDNFWRRCGGVDMTFDNFERLLTRGDRVLYFPEGVPGIGKGFNRRYQLQPFKTSFVLLAARHGVPVYPLHIINAEWVHPFGYTFPKLDRLFQRVFHVPFLPLPLGLLAILFPWIWYLAFPAKLFVAVGEPIDVVSLMQAEGITDYIRPDRAPLKRVAERIRLRMQAELTGLVEQYGQRPYHVRSLWRHIGRRLRLLPWGWPGSFLRNERDRRRPAPRNRLHAWLRDWDLLGFWLPAGWPLLSLTRAFRRPPCGYRGMSRSDRRERQGNFLWRLSERPLPSRETTADS